MIQRGLSARTAATTPPPFSAAVGMGSRAREVGAKARSAARLGASRGSVMGARAPPKTSPAARARDTRAAAAAAGLTGTKSPTPSRASAAAKRDLTSARASTTAAEASVALAAPAPERADREPTGPTRRVGMSERSTKETQVSVRVDLDGTGATDNDTGVPFLDHMLDQLGSHGLLDISVKAKGDTWIDDHHTIEDVALALGSAISEALGSRAGVRRFGDFAAPLDEALVHVVLDLSGRAHLSCDLEFRAEKIGTFPTEMVEHFFGSLAQTGGITLHVRQLAGRNAHHICEASFKAFARALRMATEPDPRRHGTVASSKGVLTQH